MKCTLFQKSSACKRFIIWSLFSLEFAWSSHIFSGLQFRSFNHLNSTWNQISKSFCILSDSKYYQWRKSDKMQKDFEIWFQVELRWLKDLNCNPLKICEDQANSRLKRLQIINLLQAELFWNSVHFNVCFSWAS